MKYLVFLHRFELDLDRLKEKIKKLDKSANFKRENKNLLISTKLDSKKLLEFTEISRVVSVCSDWKEFGFVELKKDCLELCENKKIKEYTVETKFHDKVPISSKSIYRHINPYLKHESILFNEKGELIYLEFKKIEDRLNFRIGYISNNLRMKAPLVDTSKFCVVIENPTLVSEISDFLRLCWIFKLPLYIVTKNDRFDGLLNRAKKDTKGLDDSKMKVVVSSDFPSDYLLVGFSKHASKNEVDLKPLLLSDKKIALVFGDDKYGLTQEAREGLDCCFRLSSELKKPFRGSQALSYVLGLYSGFKL